jgi:hypothetical protein
VLQKYYVVRRRGALLRQPGYRWDTPRHTPRASRMRRRVPEYTPVTPWIRNGTPPDREGKIPHTAFTRDRGWAAQLCGAPVQSQMPDITTFSPLKTTPAVHPFIDVSTLLTNHFSMPHINLRLIQLKYCLIRLTYRLKILRKTASFYLWAIVFPCKEEDGGIETRRIVAIRRKIKNRCNTST